jgi:prephenate dehydrogenase
VTDRSAPRAGVATTGGASLELGRVAIVGAGQAGTMLGLALRGVAAEVALFDRNPVAAEASLRRKAGDRTIPSLDRVAEADVVVLAVPVPEIVKLLDQLAGVLRDGTFVVDTGSAKAAVVEAMGRLPAAVHAIGGHPMAGTERAGAEGAEPLALRGATFVLTPVREDPVALRLASILAEAVGSRPVVMDAKVHDRLVARTSHLPHLLAFALAAVTARAGAPDEVAALASTGLEGATRLARSDPAMVAGFLRANADEVRAAAADLSEAVDEVLAALGGDGLEDLLAKGRSAVERLR